MKLNNLLKSKITKKTIVAYTDGSCIGNPGYAGWGVYLHRTKNGKGQSRRLSGSHPCATNNMMEMQGAIEALKATKKNNHLVVYTDSKYVQKGITEWVFGWEAKNYRNVKNAELWKELKALTVGRHITWRWVKGHSGVEGNEIADVLARTAAEDIRDEAIIAT